MQHLPLPTENAEQSNDGIPPSEPTAPETSSSLSKQPDEVSDASPTNDASSVADKSNAAAQTKAKNPSESSSPVKNEETEATMKEEAPPIIVEKEQMVEKF